MNRLRIASQASRRGITKRVLLCSALVASFACGKSKDGDSKAPPPPDNSTAKAGDDAPAKDKAKTKVPAATPPVDKSASYAALDVGADYKSWPKLNKTLVMSKTHGGRSVDTYVNAVGAAAYKSDDAEIPVGTIIVKTSWETEDGKATDVAGPTFVMERRAGAGGKEPTWFYGLHWETVPEKWQEAMGGKQAYWRTPSEKVGYCSKCHDRFDRELGGIPKEARDF